MPTVPVLFQWRIGTSPGGSGKTKKSFVRRPDQTRYADVGYPADIFDSSYGFDGEIGGAEPYPDDPLPSLVADPDYIDESIAGFNSSASYGPRFNSVEGTLTLPDTDYFLRMNSAEVAYGHPYAYGSTYSNQDWRAFLSGPGFFIRVTRVGRTYAFNGYAYGCTEGFEIEDAAGTPPLLGTNFRCAALEHVEFVIGGANSFAALDRPDPAGAYEVTFSHTFSGPSGTGVKVRATDEYGFRTGWVTVYMPPVADFEMIDDDAPVYIADASNSFSPTGTITSYTWSVQALGGSHPEVITEETPPTATLDFDGLLSDNNDNDFIAIIKLKVQATPETPINVIYWRPEVTKTITVTGDDPPGAVDHPSGIALTAVRDGNATQVHRFVDGTGSREPVARVDNLRAPQLHKAGVGSSITTLTGRVGPQYRTYISTNFGENFSFMSLIPFNTNEHKRVATCGLKSGGQVAVAARKSDGRLLFAKTLDGETWEAPEDTGIDAGSTGSRLTVYEETSGTSAIRLTNGTDFNYRKASLDSDFVEV